MPTQTSPLPRRRRHAPVPVDVGAEGGRVAPDGVGPLRAEVDDGETLDAQLGRVGTVRVRELERALAVALLVDQVVGDLR